MIDLFDHGPRDLSDQAVLIVVEGDPFGKQSVRAGLRGKRIMTYMPKETVEYEADCRREAAASMRGRPLFSGPVELKLQLFYPIPQSWSKKAKEAARLGQVVPTKKPDSSNCLGRSRTGSPAPCGSMTARSSITTSRSDSPKTPAWSPSSRRLICDPADPYHSPAGGVLVFAGVSRSPYLPIGPRTGPRIHRNTSSGLARHGIGGHFLCYDLAIQTEHTTMTELEEAIQDLELEAAEDLALDEFGDE